MNWIKQSITAGGTGTITLGAATDAAHHVISNVTDTGKQFVAMFAEGDDREISLCTLLPSSQVSRVLVKETLVGGTYNRVNPTALNLSTSATMQVVADGNGYIKASRGLPYQASPGIIGSVSMEHAGSPLANVGTTTSRKAYPYQRATSGFVSQCSIVCAGAAVSGFARIAAHEVLDDGSPGISYGEFTSSGSTLDLSTTGIKTATAASPIWLPSGPIFIVMQVSGAGISAKGVVGCTSGWLGTQADGDPVSSLFRTDDIAQIGEDETGNNWAEDTNCITFFLRDI